MPAVLGGVSVVARYIKVKIFSLSIRDGLVVMVSACQLASRGRPGVILTPFRANSLNSNPKSQFDSTSRRLISCFRCIFFLLFSFSFLSAILISFYFAYVSPRESSFHRAEKSSIAIPIIPSPCKTEKKLQAFKIDHRLHCQVKNSCKSFPR